MIRSGNTRIIWIKAAILFCIFLPCVSAQVDYRRQQIELRKISFIDGANQYGESGIQLYAEVKFAYSADQISGALDNRDKKEYYFFLEVYDSLDQKVYSPSALPNKIKKISSRDDYVVLTNSSTGWQYLRLFIPYNRIELVKGLHKATIRLHSTNKDGSVYFRNIYYSLQNISQPPTFASKIELQGLRLEEKQYDIPGSQIPIIGLFAGGQKSKSGQGLPDAGWKVIVGTDVIYESPVEVNSYLVPDGWTSFRIAEGDPVELQIIDEDYYAADDILGTMVFEPGSQATEIIKTNCRFGNVLTGTVVYRQTVAPDVNNTQVVFEKKSFQGVAGLIVHVSYSISGMLSEDALQIHPVFKDTMDQIYKPRIYKGVKLNMEKGQNNAMLDRSNHANEQTYFIPHYALPDNYYPGVEFVLDGYDLPVKKVFASERVRGITSQIKDVQITISGVEEASYKGYWGLKIPMKIEVPSMYYNDLDFSQFTHSIIVKNSKGFDITDSIMIVSVMPQMGLRNFQLRKVNDAKTLFIPYAKCIGTSNTEEFTVQYKTRFWEKGVLIGDFLDKYSIRTEPLDQLLPFEAAFKCVRKNIEYSYCRILHGNREIMRSEKVSNERIKMLVANPKSIFHPYDDITVEIMGIDYFGKEISIYKYVFNPYLLVRNALPAYDAPRGIKSFKVVRRKKTR